MLTHEQDQTEEDPGTALEIVGVHTFLKILFRLVLAHEMSLFVVGGGDEDGENTANYTMKERQSMNMSYLQSLPPNSLVVLDDNDQVGDFANY